MLGTQAIRCFIALEVPPYVQSVLGRWIADLKTAGADVKWADPASIHLTLKFLGEIPQRQVVAVGKQLELLRGRHQRMTTQLTEVGAFPNMRRPQTVWAGLELPPQLIVLFTDIENRMSAIGFTRGRRRFKPHLTLGRVRSFRNLPRLAQLISETRVAPLPFTMSALALLRSILTPAGPQYQRLTTIELG